MDPSTLQHIKTNFELLADLFGGNLDGLPESAKSESGGYMDLHFDHRYRDEQRRLVVSLAHTYQQNGDCVSDPFMELRIDYNAKTVEALAFQDATHYHEVYADNGAVNPRQCRSQNAFLKTWLQNLKQQRHSLRGVA